jgi:hypothetical protein
VAEVAADAGGVHHLLHVPKGELASVRAVFEAAVPGLRLEPATVAQAWEGVTFAVRFFTPKTALLATDDPEAARTLLGGLTALADDERVALRWALRPGGAAPDQAPTNAPTLQEATAQRVTRLRQSQPGFAVAGLLLVQAPTRARATELARHVEAAVRSRRSVGAGMLVRSARVLDATVMPSTFRRRGWLSTAEALGLLGWPLGDEVVSGVEVGAARQLPARRSVARSGRPLFTGYDARGPRPIALPPEAALHHLAVVGPSGVGKSALLARGVLADMAAGRGGVLMDPKGDTAAAVLERVPPEHSNRVVVLDPSEPGPVPGLDLFAAGDPDLRSDVVLGALAAIYGEAWVPRAETYLRLGLRTLAEQPRPVLSDWLRLFTDAPFRAQAVGRLSDPVLRMAWANFEALSPAEQAQHIAPGLNRLITLLARPAVRNVLAQEEPRLDLRRLLDERKWLIVSLAPGPLGEPAARLIGAILMYLVWSVVEARAALPQKDRHPISLVLDELQSLETLPFGLEYLFERARGLGCGVTVATQALGRLPESTRRSLLGNVGSLVSFRLNHDEATRVAHELPGLAARDLQALRRFEVAARVSSGLGSGVAVMTGRTEPLPAPTGMAGRIRQRSRDQYGGEAPDIAPEVTPGGSSAGGIGRRRRES